MFSESRFHKGLKSCHWVVKCLLGLVQIESMCRRQIKCFLKTEIRYRMGGKYCGKMRKCLLPAFSPFFPQCFQKVFFSGSSKVGIVWQRWILTFKGLETWWKKGKVLVINFFFFFYNVFESLSIFFLPYFSSTEP